MALRCRVIPPVQGISGRMGLKHLSVVTGVLESRSGGGLASHAGEGGLRIAPLDLSADRRGPDPRRRFVQMLASQGQEAAHEDGRGPDAEPGGD